jgi:hypothetical protein
VQSVEETKERYGTRTNTKFEYIALYIKEKEIDVYLIQETWLEGDLDHLSINGITFCSQKTKLKQLGSRKRPLKPGSELENGTSKGMKQWTTPQESWGSTLESP